MKVEKDYEEFLRLLNKHEAKYCSVVRTSLSSASLAGLMTPSWLKQAITNSTCGHFGCTIISFDTISDSLACADIFREILHRENPG